MGIMRHMVEHALGNGQYESAKMETSVRVKFPIWRRTVPVIAALAASPALASECRFADSELFAHEIRCTDGRYTDQAYHVTRIVDGQTIIRFSSATGGQEQEWVISPPTNCSIGPRK